MTGPAAIAERVPVTVVTGFFGSGKTSLLRRLLDADSGKRFAVVVQAFTHAGDQPGLAIDSVDAICASDAGHLCCTVCGDPLDAMLQLARRRAAGGIHFARLLLETSGLDAPAATAQAFLADRQIAAHYRLDARITMVDAFDAARHVEQFRVVREQIRLADRILVAKSDLVSPAHLHSLIERLHAINARAPVMLAHFGHTDLSHLHDIDACGHDDIVTCVPAWSHDGGERHDALISSFVFRATRPFVAGKLEALMSALFQHHGEAMLRYKGVIEVAGIPAQVIFQGLQTQMVSTSGRLWGASERRASVLQFIGCGLPQDLFMQRLGQCLTHASSVH
ncbi:CobW family GTP-binding protein [Massilia sp. S19_KUP03_FR1]|uniref:CobW family GTP-binding protein n=1 Tax=Massilia sp. S19_KUP03_FR1 TaxID=3025503 RepID=UPI002FCDB8A2